MFLVTDLMVEGMCLHPYSHGFFHVLDGALFICEDSFSHVQLAFAAAFDSIQSFPWGGYLET